MKNNAMLIDYGFCTGCKSCEISCRNEKGLSHDEWGIKIVEIGPQKMEGEWEWDYLPILSQACDLCVQRTDQGILPACQLHCLANVIKVIPVDDASREMGELGRNKLVVYVP